MISKFIPDLLSCPTHLHQILAPKKIVDNEKSIKKLPSYMYDDFHAHLVETYLKAQVSNMHKELNEKMQKDFPYIFTKERCRTSSVREITLMRFVKDMDSPTS